jgi:O-antigen ligase
MTGERINFLIRACGGMLAGLVWKPKWGRYLGLVAVEVLAVAIIFSALPRTASRFMDQFIAGATNPLKSAWIKTMNGGWQVAQENLMFGIGTANYRLVSYEGILDKYENVRPDVHPHNYYVQMLLETGLIGFILGVVFLWSIVWTCFKASLRNRDNVFIATAWVIPFGLFWPIATSADFFGQWNNIFMWSAVALAISINARSSFN